MKERKHLPIYATYEQTNLNPFLVPDWGIKSTVDRVVVPAR